MLLHNPVLCQPNASTMGADQFDITIEQDKKEAKQFFSYFYWRYGDITDGITLSGICAYFTITCV
jgi:hypothetical protein